MAKRELEEINAGSMADIAFLLLIFFLVTTTMNFPKVLEERLPQKLENPPEFLVKPENVLEILANKKDQILIEGRPGEIEDIKDKVIEFYNHPMSDKNWPELVQITEAEVEKQINIYKTKVAQYPDISLIADTLSRWEAKRNVVAAIGPYNEISDKAMITIQLDNATSFKTYVSVLNEIMAGINQLRSDLCLAKFGVPYNRLNKKVEEDKAILKILRQVYPKRIMKAKSRNAG